MTDLSIGAPALPGRAHDAGELIEAINNHSAEQIAESIAASYLPPHSVIYNWEAWLHARGRELPAAEEWGWQHEYAWEMLRRANCMISDVKRLMKINAPHAREKAVPTYQKKR